MGARAAGTAPAIETSLVTRMDLLADLGDEEMTAVEQACRYRRFAAQEQVIDRESSATTCFSWSGESAVVNFSLLGRESTFDELGEGSYFGELFRLDGKLSIGYRHGHRRCPDRRGAGAPVHESAGKPSEDSVVGDEAAGGHQEHGETRGPWTSTVADTTGIPPNCIARRGPRRRTAGNAAQIEPIPAPTAPWRVRVSTTRETVARVLSDLARRGIVERMIEELLVIHNVDRLRDIVQEVRGSRPIQWSCPDLYLIFASLKATCLRTTDSTSKAPFRRWRCEGSSWS